MNEGKNKNQIHWALPLAQVSNKSSQKRDSIIENKEDVKVFLKKDPLAFIFQIYLLRWSVLQ